MLEYRQRRIKAYIRMLEERKFRNIMHFIIESLSIPTIKYNITLRILHIDLGFKKFKTWPENRGQSSSGGPPLEKVMSKFDIHSTDSIIDIGSGKGGALMTLCKYPFRTVDGVEIDEESYEISKVNLSKTPHKSVEIYLSDARNFDKYSDYNYFYLSNPFSNSTMKKVLGKITQSIVSNPRDIVLIYNSPKEHETVVKSKLFVKYIEPNIPSIDIKIYTNNINFKLKGMK